MKTILEGKKMEVYIDPFNWRQNGRKKKKVKRRQFESKGQKQLIRAQSGRESEAAKIQNNKSITVFQTS